MPLISGVFKSARQRSLCAALASLALLLSSPSDAEQRSEQSAQLGQRLSAPNFLQNPGFEASPASVAPWETVVHAVAGAYSFQLREGKGRRRSTGLEIKRVLEEPWGGVLQIVDSSQLRVAPAEISVWIKAKTYETLTLYATWKDARGTQRLEKAILPAGRENRWTKLRLAFDLDGEARQFEVGLDVTGAADLVVDEFLFVQTAAR